MDASSSQKAISTGASPPDGPLARAPLGRGTKVAIVLGCFVLFITFVAVGVAVIGGSGASPNSIPLPDASPTATASPAPSR